MEITELKNLLFEFGENVRFEHDLKKKKIGSILVENQKFFTRLKI